MSAPFLLVTTHVIDRDKLAEYRDQQDAFAAFVHDHEPGLLDFRSFLEPNTQEATFVFAFADADAADTHFQLTGELIARGLEITRTARIEVFGRPGPLLRQVVEGNAAAGVPIRILDEQPGGFSRLPIAISSAT